MRMTKRGIGIDKVAFGLSGCSVSGNDKFVSWGANGVKLSKLINPGGGELIVVLRLNPSAPKTQTTTYYPGNQWRTNYSAEQKKAPRLPKFGLTDPVAVDLSDDGLEMRITMPPADKRAKPVRGPNKKNRGKKAAQLEMPGVSTPYTNSIEKVMADIAGGHEQSPVMPEVAAMNAPQVAEPQTLPGSWAEASPAPTESTVSLEQALDKIMSVLKRHGLKIEAKVILE